EQRIVLSREDLGRLPLRGEDARGRPAVRPACELSGAQQPGAEEVGGIDPQGANDAFSRQSEGLRAGEDEAEVGMPGGYRVEVPVTFPYPLEDEGLVGKRACSAP